MTDLIMNLVDSYGFAENRQDDGQALYARNLLEVKIAELNAERDALELRIGAMIVERSDAFFKVIQERDALKDAARLALDALEVVEPYINTTATACRGDKCREPWCASCNTEEEAEASAQKGYRAEVKALSTIAALKAVL